MPKKKTGLAEAVTTTPKRGRRRRFDLASIFHLDADSVAKLEALMIDTETPEDEVVAMAPGAVSAALDKLRNEVLAAARERISAKVEKLAHLEKVGFASAEPGDVIPED